MANLAVSEADVYHCCLYGVVFEYLVEYDQRFFGSPHLVIHVASESLSECMAAEIAYLDVVFVFRAFQVAIYILPRVNLISLVIYKDVLVNIRLFQFFVKFGQMFRRIGTDRYGLYFACLFLLQGDRAFAENFTPRQFQHVADA